MKFICVIPCNIYGENDNLSLEEGHVIPALIHQCYLAKKFNKPFIVKSRLMFIFGFNDFLKR